jgi:hypothetical protein
MTHLRKTTSAPKTLLVILGLQGVLCGGAFAGGHHDFNGKNVTAQINQGPKVRDHTGSGPGPNQVDTPSHRGKCSAHGECFQGTVRDHRVN